MPFRIFRGPLFHKSVTGQELFFAVSYSKPALEFIKISFKYSSNDHHSLKVDDSVADNHLPTTVLKSLFDYDYLLLVVGPLGCCTLIFFMFFGF